MPFDRSRYPADWEDISRRVRERAQCQPLELGPAMRCECRGECGTGHDGRCEAIHGHAHPVTGSKVILTAAHLWRGPCAEHHAAGVLCGDMGHLAAMCQRCHLSYDRDLNNANAARRRHARRAAGDLFDGGA